jgi:hypothetical protein
MAEVFKSKRLRFLLVILIAVLANVLWLGEIVWIKGWAGTRWLSGQMWASVFVCMLVPTATLLTVRKDRGGRPIKMIGFVLITGAVLMICYEIVRDSLYSLHSVGFLALLLQGDLLQDLKDLAVLAGIPFAVILASLTLHVMLHVLIQPMKKTALFYFAGAFLLVGPASVASVLVLPALNGSTDYIHAVKMGYPAFWSVICAALAALPAQQRMG